MKKQAVVINVKDNVATLVDDFTSGTEIHYFLGDQEQSVILLQDIPLGHKVALREIKKGEEVIKYGESLGGATADIKVGQHVHVHNMESLRGRGDK
ncbi:altronate dehydratase [Desulfosporosinus acidiphilus SJ4]|uniref:Altronate dehydratase n=1 Tax=Desulfosporosinus acidiphilus (strain DSM 22704 / JCM 16185 / SJ4) TaxID=646529 RepID=I4D115_DESAJ|nr:UxaA family hydrolase [Desulfosporosinus acidiphilus]AFM39489.1 altronate dehydratase [Desulfosporosinus acidiphilus SJ4]